jgi:hypothetical protein
VVEDALSCPGRHVIGGVVLSGRSADENLGAFVGEHARRNGTVAARSRWLVLLALLATAMLAIPVAHAGADTGTVWRSGFTAHGFSRFKDTPYNNVGASAPVLVTSTVAPPARAALFTVPAGGTRSEIEPNVRNFVEGSEYYFGDSITLPPSFPTAETSWQVITQWKNNGDGSPPVELKVGSGNIVIDGGYGYPTGPRLWSRNVGPAATGRQIQLVVHIKFSSNPAVGSLDVWMDGRKVISGYKPPAGTLYPKYKKQKAAPQQAAAQAAAAARAPRPAGTPTEPAAATDEAVTASTTASQFSYWKMGLYRDPAITSNASYYIESARLATTYAGAAGGAREPE